MHISILYDGKCPVCSNIVEAAELRRKSSSLELIDVRRQAHNDIQGHDMTTLDFNEGFCLVVDGTIYFGSEAACMLAFLFDSTSSQFRVFRFLMRSESSSRFWYPLLKCGRNVLLFLFRIPKIPTPT